jgi:hypothetical protein
MAMEQLGAQVRQNAALVEQMAAAASSPEVSAASGVHRPGASGLWQ